MKIEPLDTNVIGNLGLVNCQKIQLRKHSVIFHQLFKNAVSQSSYTSFFPEKSLYTYTDIVTGREIVGGLMLLKLMYAVIYRNIRLDHRIHQLQERQPANYFPSHENIGVRVQPSVREEGSTAGPGHGVLKKVMKYHAVLTPLDLLEIHKSQVTNCIGIEGLDLHVG